MARAAEDLLEPQFEAERNISASPDALAQSDDVQAQVMDDRRLGDLNPAWSSYRMSRDAWSTLVERRTN